MKAALLARPAVRLRSRISAAKLYARGMASAISSGVDMAASALALADVMLFRSLERLPAWSHVPAKGRVGLFLGSARNDTLLTRRCHRHRPPTPGQSGEEFRDKGLKC